MGLPCLSKCVSIPFVTFHEQILDLYAALYHLVVTYPTCTENLYPFGSPGSECFHVEYLVLLGHNTHSHPRRRSQRRPIIFMNLDREGVVVQPIPSCRDHERLSAARSEGL